MLKLITVRLADVRLGVLDVGSNTVHLVVVDAYQGGRPSAMSNWKTTMRLMEHIGPDGELTAKGQNKLIKGVAEAADLASTFGCEEMIPFATSAVRSATNSDDVLRAVKDETGVELRILSGEDEARLTFLAVRRWFGWSAGRIIDLDIGGGSLELSSGSDEKPQEAFSVLLGANRLTHDWLEQDPPDRKRINALRDYIDAELAAPAEAIKAHGAHDLAVGTSKTFRTLARLTGAAPSSAGPRVKRTLTQHGVRQLIAFISRMTAADRAELEGVSTDRAPQIVAGALVAEGAMRALNVDQLQICPWALREGVIMRYTDSPDFAQLVGR